MNKTNSPMSPSQEREAALFSLALEKPASERPAFLKLLCGADNALRARLEALLAAHDQTDNLLPTQIEAERPMIKRDVVDDRFDEAVGQTLGRYKLMEKIGEGGCGVVYVAEQTEPVRRRVALLRALPLFPHRAPWRCWDDPSLPAPAARLRTGR